MKKIIMAIIALSLMANVVFSGPNSKATIKIDFDAYSEMLDSECPDEGEDSEITCAVIVNNVVDLDGYALLVKYNPEIVNVEWADKKPKGTNIVPFLESNGGKIGAFISKPADGIVDIAASLIGKSREEAPDGSGALVYIKFKRLKSGDAGVLIEDAQVIDSELVTDNIISKR